MAKKLQSWWDLTPMRQMEFAKRVRASQLVGWDNLKQAAWDFGFEPSEDMPTVFELQKVAGKGEEK